MRLFIAIQPTEEIVSELTRLQSLLPELRMSRPKEFHLTLKFLGELEDVESIKSSLSSVTFKPFTLTLSQLGAFPNPKSPRVIWAGLKDSLELMSLHKQIAFPDDRRFHPHFTLARVKQSSDVSKFISSTKVNPLTFKVSSFGLIRSVLTPQGPHYSILERYGNVFKQ